MNQLDVFQQNDDDGDAAFTGSFARIQFSLY